MPEPTLSQIMAEIKKANGKLDKIDERVSELEKDMKKVLKFVATDNAEFTVRRVPTSGSGK
jgi:peptidoglycan hydrolase CwlO-like protein